MQIDYTPAPTVSRFMESEAYVRALMGPYGSGKSAGCVMELLRRAAAAPKNSDGVRRSRFVIIRNTYKMLHDTTLNTVFEWVPPGQAGKWVSSRNNYEVKFGDVESLWMFRALDHPDDIRNLLSLEVTGAWINEYREIDPDVFVNLLGRVGRYRPDKDVDRGWFGIIMDTNPPSVDSFWYALFEDEPSEEVNAAMQRLNKGAENPRPLLELYKQPSGLSNEAENIENLPEGYYDLLMAANADKSREWANVHVRGQYGFVQDGKPVFPEFSDTHAPDNSLIANPNQVIVVGRDFGLTPAAVACQQSVDGRWLVLGELVADNCGEEQFDERMYRWLATAFPEHLNHGLVREVVGDPAGQHRSQTDEKTCFQVLRSNGWTVRPGPQDLETRLGSVRRVLNRMVDGQPGLLVDPSCRTVLKGFYGAYRYRRKKTSTEEYEEVPEKNDVSHPMDALQYVLGFYEGQGLKGRANRQFGGKGLNSNKPIKGRQSWTPW